jgi:23S rRNA-/tRNA-specific pseudouridylate synthase
MEGALSKQGLIHRLDKDTDGLMIIAKSEKGLTYFKDLFDRKSHHAVEGNMEEVVPLAQILQSGVWAY